MLVNEAMTFEACSKEQYRIAVVGHFTFYVCRFTPADCRFNLPLSQGLPFHVSRLPFHAKNTAAGIATRSSMFRNKNRDDWS